MRRYKKRFSFGVFFALFFLILNSIWGQTVVGKISRVGLEPFSVEVYEKENKVVIGDNKTGNLYFYDCTTLSEKGSVHIGSEILQMVIDEVSGKIYATCEAPPSLITKIAVVDAKTETFIRYLSEGSWWGGYWLQPDGFVMDSELRKLYALHIEGLTQIDMVTDEETEVPGFGGGGIEAIGINPVTHEVFVVRRFETYLAIINGKTLEKTIIEGLHGAALGVNWRENKIYLATGGGVGVPFYIYNRNSGNTTTIYADNDALRWAYNSTSNQMHTSAEVNRISTIIDGSTDSFFNVELDGSTTAVAVRYETNHVYYAGRDFIAVMEGTSKNVQRIPVDNPSASQGGVIVQDIAVNQSNGRIFVINDGYSLNFVTVIQDNKSMMEEKNPPFGTFETPIHGSTVASSIAVTGWALDDSGVDHVKIYRGQGSQLFYIGDATLVEGARPDVAASYPQYPNNTRAGWGYMMLTNFLPNGGNGTFTLNAIATDTVGKTTTLGTKTIYCDNANAVKPFGAIDTPTQGGNASGSSFINWGWVLTPQPNSIPTDGSTINVYVDGVNIGQPTYNKYRADLASLFPGYANSNGAAGYFYLDTTGYADGVHTIQWTAKDTGDNTDGIGSRYFSISNNGSSDSGMRKQSYNYLPKQKTTIHNLSQIVELPIDYSAPVRFKQGYNENTLPTALSFGESGMNPIVIEEMERIEIHLSDQAAGYSYNGYLTVGDRMMALPVGSTLNPKTGVFSWIPGPGYLGRFHFVFIGTGPDGAVTKMNVMVEIVPKKYKSE
jgi:hypothetical protein